VRNALVKNFSQMPRKDWCESLGTNVKLDCEFDQAARKLILFPSDRAKS